MEPPKSNPAPLREIPIGRLESWKEIAAYLRRDVRTVQRWEHTKDLPVRRLPGGDQARIYALKSELDAWWNSRGIHLIPDVEANDSPTEPRSPSPTPPVAKPRLRQTVVLISLLVLIGGAVAIWIHTASSPLSFQKRDWVLITDFENQTSDPVFDKSLLTAFTVGLEQSRYANVVPRNAITAALQRMNRNPETRIDEQLGREICQREHFKGLIHCFITGSGHDFALGSRLVDPQTGVALRAYLESARNQDEVIGALGRLAARIRQDLGESLASIRQNDEPLPQVTTSSLEALRFFSEGNHLWQKGQYPEAMKSWQSAVEHDPGFAMAHAALGDACMSHIFNAERAAGKAHYQKALQNLQRITEREQFRIQASYQANLGHIKEATKVYRVYLNAFPDDISMRFGFGTFLMLNRQHEEAIGEFQQVLHTDPKRARAWIGLATCYRELNQYPEALAAYAKAFALEPAWVTLGNLNHEYGFALAMNGDIPKAREVFALALAKPNLEGSGLRSMALLDMYQGKYQDAEQRLRRAIVLTEKDTLVKARNHLYLAILLSGVGDTAGQTKELDRASAALAAWPDTPVWLHARVGAAYARAGVVSKAGQILRKLTAEVDPDDSASIVELHILEGEIALANRDCKRSIELFQPASQSTGVPLQWASLGRAYLKAGDLEHAAASYEMLIELRGRSLGWEPQQDWLEAHAAVAEIYLKQGKKAPAMTRQNELAQLWKDADRDLSLMRKIKSW